MFAFTLVGVGQGVIFAAGVVTAAGVLAKTRPARWVWRRNVGEPVRAALRAELAPIVAELQPNGGASFRDQVLGRLDGLDGRMDGLDNRVESCEGELARINERLDG